jgi:hypothetical protein
LKFLMTMPSLENIEQQEDPVVAVSTSNV